MIINGVKLDVDFTDADVLEKIEVASKKVFEESEKLKGNEYTPAEGIRQECKILGEFIDYVFGEGKSEELFKGKNSLQLYIKAFEDIINERDKQVKSINDLVSKYSPDRVQR